MKAVKIITYIIVTVAIIAVLAAIGFFVYNFVRNGQKSFYLSYGNEKILAGTSEIELPSNTTVFFTGRTIAGVSDESTQVENYTVSVVPTQKLVTAIRYRVGEEKETYLSGDTDFPKRSESAKKARRSRCLFRWSSSSKPLYPKRSAKIFLRLRERRRTKAITSSSESFTRRRTQL